jgi:hypothetical protein
MALLSGTEAALQAIAILENWQDAPNYPLSKASVVWDTFAEERGEALAAVLEALALRTGDQDRVAACLSLLEHLIAPPRGRRALPS